MASNTPRRTPASMAPGDVDVGGPSVVMGDHVDGRYERTHPATRAMTFGVSEPGSVWQVATVIPEFLRELSLAIWLVARGLDPSAAILSEPVNPDGGAASGDRRPLIVPSEA